MIPDISPSFFFLPTYAAVSSQPFALGIDFKMQAVGEKQERDMHCIWCTWAPCNLKIH